MAAIDFFFNNIGLNTFEPLDLISNTIVLESAQIRPTRSILLINWIFIIVIISLRKQIILFLSNIKSNMKIFGAEKLLTIKEKLKKKMPIYLTFFNKPTRDHISPESLQSKRSSFSPL